MEIANGYEIDNGLNPLSSSFQNRNLPPSKSTYYASENKDKNNNYNNKSTTSQQISQSISQPNIQKTPSHNDFDLNRIIKKLEKENKNSKEFDMKLISMQSTNHNVDLVINTYIEKVVLIVKF
jgi:hypothetical protein